MIIPEIVTRGCTQVIAYFFPRQCLSSQMTAVMRSVKCIHQHLMLVLFPVYNVCVQQWPTSLLALVHCLCVTLMQVLNLLRRHYPPHIMPNLQRYSQAAMHDMSDAFPQGPSLDHSNLNSFLEVTHYINSHCACNPWSMHAGFAGSEGSCRRQEAVSTWLSFK